jgi:hypothetical protein
VPSEGIWSKNENLNPPRLSVRREQLKRSPLPSFASSSPSCLPSQQPLLPFLLVQQKLSHVLLVERL